MVITSAAAMASRALGKARASDSSTHGGFAGSRLDTGFSGDHGSVVELSVQDTFEFVNG
jgi:hypothetical protein